MSYHDDYFAAQGLPLLLESQGRSITVTSPAGAATTLTAIVGAETQQEAEESDRRTRKRTRSLVILTDSTSVYGGIDAPTTGYTATIDAVVYEFDQISVKEGGFANVTLARDAAMERSRKGFRGRM